MSDDQHDLPPVPAWVEGLMRLWGDWRRSGGLDGDIQALSGESNHWQRTPSGCGGSPVERALLAAERAQNSDCVLLEALYRCLPVPEQEVVFAHYVCKRPYGDIPGFAKTTAWRHCIMAGWRMREWVAGLQRWKGDDGAAWVAVRRAQRRRKAAG